MKNYKQMLYGISAIAALGGAVSSYNEGYKKESLIHAIDTPVMQQMRSLENEILNHSTAPLKGDLQEIATKYSKLDGLRRSHGKEHEAYSEAYNEAFRDMSVYATITSILTGASLVLGGLATGKVKIGK